MNVTAPSVPYWAGGAVFSSDRADGGQNFLGKGDHQTTKQAVKALCPLAGVVGLDRHTHLHNAPPNKISLSCAR